MKKIIALLIAALLCFGTCAVAEETYRIGICQLVQHVALDAATQGFQDALKAKLGDAVTYTTSAGTRTYAVTTVAKIGSDDWSYLGATTDNRITLITCVAGDASQRWVVQAVQK